jgi:F420H(2)-dependent quinone reductase
MAVEQGKQFTRGHEILLKFLRKLIEDGNMWLLKISGGKMGNSFLGVPVLLMTTIGRKSQQPRTHPLYYVEHEDQILVVASNAGTSSDPAWLLNIRAYSSVSVDLKGQKMNLTAREASVEEKSSLWYTLTSAFPKWQMMEDRSTREFPVVILQTNE